MATGAKSAKLYSSAQNLQCVASFPRVQINGVTVRLSSLDRRGAVIHATLLDFQGAVVRKQDPVLLEVSLPPNATFGRRAMHCAGKATHVSESIDGTFWLTVRFHQLCFQQVAPGQTNERNPVSRKGDDRGPKAAGTDNSAGNGLIDS